jgi:hypothetical protein
MIFNPKRGLWDKYCSGNAAIPAIDSQPAGTFTANRRDAYILGAKVLEHRDWLPQETNR